MKEAPDGARPRVVAAPLWALVLAVLQLLVQILVLSSPDERFACDAATLRPAPKALLVPRPHAAKRVAELAQLGDAPADPLDLCFAVPLQSFAHDEALRSLSHKLPRRLLKALGGEIADILGDLSALDLQNCREEATCRLSVVDKTPCPRLHLDQCAWRAIVAYTRGGTVLLDEREVNWEAFHRRSDFTGADSAAFNKRIERRRPFTPLRGRAVGRSVPVGDMVVLLGALHPRVDRLHPRGDRLHPRGDRSDAAEMERFGAVKPTIHRSPFPHELNEEAHKRRVLLSVTIDPKDAPH
eukprot:scaffold5113_cov364-Pinguiococcus_pyrenoidosus.AAC.1